MHLGQAYQTKVYSFRCFGEIDYYKDRCWDYESNSWKQPLEIYSDDYVASNWPAPYIIVEEFFKKKDKTLRLITNKDVDNLIRFINDHPYIREIRFQSDDFCSSDIFNYLSAQLKAQCANHPRLCCVYYGIDAIDIFSHSKDISKKAEKLDRCLSLLINNSESDEVVRNVAKSTISKDQAVVANAGDCLGYQEAAIFLLVYHNNSNLRRQLITGQLTQLRVPTVVNAIIIDLCTIFRSTELNSNVNLETLTVSGQLNPVDMVPIDVVTQADWQTLFTHIKTLNCENRHYNLQAITGMLDVITARGNNLKLTTLNFKNCTFDDDALVRLMLAIVRQQDHDSTQYLSELGCVRQQKVIITLESCNKGELSVSTDTEKKEVHVTVTGLKVVSEPTHFVPWSQSPMVQSITYKDCHINCSSLLNHANLSSNTSFAKSQLYYKPTIASRTYIRCSLSAGALYRLSLYSTIETITMLDCTVAGATISVSANRLELHKAHIDDFYEALRRILRSSKQWQSIILHDCTIDDVFYFKQLLAELDENNNPFTLVLNGEATWLATRKNLDYIPKMAALAIHNVQFTPDCVTSLLTTWGRKLNAIDLSDCQFPDFDHAETKELFPELGKLAQVTLSRTNINQSNSVFQAVLTDLLSPNQIQTLVLNELSLSDQQVKDLVATVAINTSVTTLHLNNVAMSAESMTHISTLLLKRPTLMIECDDKLAAYLKSTLALRTVKQALSAANDPCDLAIFKKLCEQLQTSIQTFSDANERFPEPDLLAQLFNMSQEASDYDEALLPLLKSANSLKLQGAEAMLTIARSRLFNSALEHPTETNLTRAAKLLADMKTESSHAYQPAALAYYQLRIRSIIKCAQPTHTQSHTQYLALHQCLTEHSELTQHKNFKPTLRDMLIPLPFAMFADIRVALPANFRAFLLQQLKDKVTAVNSKQPIGKENYEQLQAVKTVSGFKARLDAVLKSGDSLTAYLQPLTGLSSYYQYPTSELSLLDCLKQFISNNVSTEWQGKFKAATTLATVFELIPAGIKAANLANLETADSPVAKFLNELQNDWLEATIDRTLLNMYQAVAIAALEGAHDKATWQEQFQYATTLEKLLTTIAECSTAQSSRPAQRSLTMLQSAPHFDTTKLNTLASELKTLLPQPSAVVSPK